jgi:hypothetical protein
LFNQQQCFIYSTASFLSKLKYWNWILEPGTTISGFADNKKKKKKIHPGRPTLDFFDM